MNLVKVGDNKYWKIKDIERKTILYNIFDLT